MATCCKNLNHIQPGQHIHAYPATPLKIKFEKKNKLNFRTVSGLFNKITFQIFLKLTYLCPPQNSTSIAIPAGENYFSKFPSYFLFFCTTMCFFKVPNYVQVQYFKT